MNTESIERHFGRMGARLEVQKPQPPSGRSGFWWNPPTSYSLDIERDRAGERFVLSVPDAIEREAEFAILQIKPRERHLLLMARRDGSADIDRFLCGHDEREWFVAAVPGAVSTVADAMESLKPREILNAQSRAGLDGKQRNRRKNKAFRRQGEWFFVPDDIDPDANAILRNEPIARSGGKPHMVEMLYRSGGERIYTCEQRPRGLSENAYKRLLKVNGRAKGWNWQVMVRNPSVYAKGAIRHPDHKTIVLHEWHQVLMNTENQSRSMQHVAFID